MTLIFLLHILFGGWEGTEIHCTRALKLTIEFTGIISAEMYELFNKLKLNIYLRLPDSSDW